VAALLLASRRVASGSLLTAVDWQLLLLIACLFVVTGAFAASLNTAAVDALRVVPPPESLRVLAPAALLLSNTIGNVPATILIVSVWPTLAAGTLTGLALLSTLAGNLLLVGSLCNIIVAERAAQHGTPLTFRDFARAGVPMTVASMLVAALWLRAGGWMPV
jgi:Na+/H+ antiporter NhaD/arsenite permease-like protein